MARPDPHAQRVTAQAIDFLYSSLPRMIVSGTVLPLVVVAVMWRHIDHRLLLGWCMAILVLTAVRLLMVRRYMRRAGSSADKLADAPRWGRYFTLTALLNGLLWGSAAMMFFVPDSASLQVFLFASIIGYSVISLIVLAPRLESYYALVIPALTLPALRFFLEGNAAYQGLAALLLLALVVLLLVGINARRYALQGIRLRFENLDLVEQLRVEKDRAETASRDKTRFLASASHDLRQPVNALSLFADVLHTELATTATPKAKVMLNHMADSIRALNQLLGSLLDISKLDANIVQPNLLHFELSALIDALHAEYVPQAQAQGLVFETRIEAGLLAHSDPVLLESMLRNLISNALRYTQQGSVTLAVARLGMMAQIDVRDTGIGIAREQHREIFREFFQLTNPERDRSKGLGLGLAIVERLAALLGHRILLDSEPGKGSCFSIVLPVVENAGENAAKLMRGVAGESATDIWVEPDDYRFNGMRVLVIDDEIAIRLGMSAVLENWGCAATLANSAEEALEKMTGHPPPQVIIADYRLRDEKTGAQAIAAIHRTFGKHIPALIITGDTGPERLREAQASGHTLMHKPIQPAKLRAYLRRIQRREMSPPAVTPP